MLNVLDFTDPEFLMSRYLEQESRIAALESKVEKFISYNKQSEPCSHDWQQIPTSYGMYVCSKCHRVRA